MKYLKKFSLTESIDSIQILNYENSEYLILLGQKTNLFKDLFNMYQHKVDGDKVYFFQSNHHFATLFKSGSFIELKHDGSVDENGGRIVDTGDIKNEVDEWMWTITDYFQEDSSKDSVRVTKLKQLNKIELILTYRRIFIKNKSDYDLFFSKIEKIFNILKRDLELDGIIFFRATGYRNDIKNLSEKYNGEEISISFFKKIEN